MWDCQWWIKQNNMTSPSLITLDLCASEKSSLMAGTCSSQTSLNSSIVTNIRTTYPEAWTCKTEWQCISFVLFFLPKIVTLSQQFVRLEMFDQTKSPYFWSKGLLKIIKYLDINRFLDMYNYHNDMFSRRWLKGKRGRTFFFGVMAKTEYFVHVNTVIVPTKQGKSLFLFQFNKARWIK